MSFAFFIASVKDSVLPSASFVATPRRPSAPTLPSCALAIAAVTASSGLPLAAEMSMATASKDCALSVSLVTATSAARAGRSSPSATPVAFCIFVIQRSVSRTCAEVAFAFVFSAFERRAISFSSAMAAFVASAKPATIGSVTP